MSNCSPGGSGSSKEADPGKSQASTPSRPRGASAKEGVSEGPQAESSDHVAGFNPNMQPTDPGFHENMAKGIQRYRVKKAEIAALKTQIKNKRHECTRTYSLARPKKRVEIAALCDKLHSLEQEVETVGNGIGPVKESFDNAERFREMEQRRQEEKYKALLKSRAIKEVPSDEEPDSSGALQPYQPAPRSPGSPSATPTGTPTVSPTEIRAAESLRPQKMVFSSEEIEDIDPREKVKQRRQKHQPEVSDFIYVASDFPALPPAQNQPVSLGVSQAAPQSGGTAAVAENVGVQSAPAVLAAWAQKPNANVTAAENSGNVPSVRNAEQSVEKNPETEALCHTAANNSAEKQDVPNVVRELSQQPDASAIHTTSHLEQDRAGSDNHVKEKSQRKGAVAGQQEDQTDQKRKRMTMKKTKKATKAAVQKKKKDSKVDSCSSAILDVAVSGGASVRGSECSECSEEISERMPEVSAGECTEKIKSVGASENVSGAKVSGGQAVQVSHVQEVGVSTSTLGAGEANVAVVGVSTVNEGASGQSFANVVRGRESGGVNGARQRNVPMTGVRVRRGDQPAVAQFPRRGRMYPSDSGRRKIVVRLQWEGEGPLPDGNIIIDKICDMGFSANDLNCFVHNKVFKDYSISFMRVQELEEFWSKFREFSDSGMWEGFRAVPISRPRVCKVTILLENESIPPADLKVWLKRYGDVIGELEKVFGYRGIWTGSWQAKVRLRTVGNVPQHIPSSAYIGRDLVCCLYLGQPKECWKCGSTRHFSISCDLLKYAMCLGVGHVAKHCPKSIRCNLCGVLGHAYGSCPMSWQSIDEEFRMEVVEPETEAPLGQVVAMTPLVPDPDPIIPHSLSQPPKTPSPPKTPQPSETPQPPTSFRPMRGRGRGRGQSRGKPLKAAEAKKKAYKTVNGGNHRKKGNGECAESAHSCVQEEGGGLIPLSANRFAPLSWGERVEHEEQEFEEEEQRVSRELASSDSSSYFEKIDPAEAEKLPFGISAKRECSDDDRKAKRRAETSSS
ncbi:hypothetical protein XELAEV_18034093mg [Xenopus laevis]|uniref:CCHC-type domain-containing protein n=1 Tax=Xenopus laevis TaxID=8355 RepID=A0A974CKI4_XENLA|nr:hypothetical protein XELAEV_18034093mg [Xenopus laevis]